MRRRQSIGTSGLLILLFLGMPALRADDAPNELREEFTGGDFNRARWALSNTVVAATKVNFTKRTMRLIIPPGGEMRPLIGLGSRFGLEGDFDVQVDFLIRSLPKPVKEWANVSVFIQGQDGMAAISRTHAAASGHGYSPWFQPDGDRKASIKGGGASGDDKAGTLRLVRIGKQLEYFIAPKGKPARSIATAEFGDRPIQTVAFQVLAPAMKTPIDVEFDDIRIKADHLTNLVYAPEASSWSFPWIAGIGGSLALLIALVWWFALRGREERNEVRKA